VPPRTHDHIVPIQDLIKSFQILIANLPVKMIERFLWSSEVLGALVENAALNEPRAEIPCSQEQVLHLGLRGWFWGRWGAEVVCKNQY
jgi:hypothetical protein